MATSTNHYLNDNVSCVARMQTVYIISNIIILLILQVQSYNKLIRLFTKSLPTSTTRKCSWNWYSTALRYARVRGSIFLNYSRSMHYIILFFPYEFTSQVLIKVFNEVISTQDHMSYFLFSPPGFLRKYIRHIYCPLNSMGFLVLS